MNQRTVAGFLVLFALACGGATSPSDDSTGDAPVTLQPDGAGGRDVWISSIFDHGDDFGVDDEKLEVGGWADYYHTLIQFDLSGLPSQAEAAHLVLSPFSRGDQSTPVPMFLYRPTSAWNESTGWPTRPPSVFVANLPAPIVGTPYSIDVTATYNSWRSGAIPNFGLELRPVSNANRFNVFRSSDYGANPSQRPKLVVVPATGASSDRFTWPIDPANPSQGTYGPCPDNPTCFWLDTPNGWRDVQPFLRYPFISPLTGNTVYHIGADWNRGTEPTDAGLPVHAIGDGTVIAVHTAYPTWGNIVFIRHDTSFGVYTSMYAHVSWMPSGPPPLGSVVRGAQIAVLGNGSNGGDAYPYHLHLEIRHGTDVVIGRGYADSQTAPTAQAQIDPNAFIAAHRN